jgi:hypothetical protein
MRLSLSARRNHWRESSRPSGGGVTWTPRHTPCATQSTACGGRSPDTNRQCRADFDDTVLEMGCITAPAIDCMHQLFEQCLLKNNSSVLIGTEKRSPGAIYSALDTVHPIPKCSGYRRSSTLLLVTTSEFGRSCECHNRSERSKRNVSRRVNMMYALIKAPRARGWSNH